MKLEKYVADYIWNIKVNEIDLPENKKSWKGVWKESSKE
jgi:hypothetical protein